MIQGAGAGADRARAPDAMRDVFETMQKLEPGVVALEHPMIATSIAVSLKRIADALTQIAGNTSSISYDNNRLRDQLRENFRDLTETYQKALK